MSTEQFVLFLLTLTLGCISICGLLLFLSWLTRPKPTIASKQDEDLHTTEEDINAL